MTTETENNAAQTRQRGILSEADREFLMGEKDLTEGAERNTRQRIRDRLKTALEDFRLLWNTLPERELELVFNPDDEEEQEWIRSASHYVIAFIWLGLWANRDPHEERIEDALEQAAFNAGWMVNFDLSLDGEPLPNGDLLLATMEHKHQKIMDLRERLAQEELTESLENEIKDEVRYEAKLQYCLFEKGLSDTSVDAERFVDIPFMDIENELTAAEVEECQSKWEDSPYVRRSFPIVQNVERGGYVDRDEVLEEVEE
jgi:hypothetical protein